jgi:hypothetical protein
MRFHRAVNRLDSAMAAAVPRGLLVHEDGVGGGGGGGGRLHVRREAGS